MNETENRLRMLNIELEIVNFREKNKPIAQLIKKKLGTDLYYMLEFD